jgi:hypothetical protein
MLWAFVGKLWLVFVGPSVVVCLDKGHLNGLEWAAFWSSRCGVPASIFSILCASLFS